MAFLKLSAYYSVGSRDANQIVTKSNCDMETLIAEFSLAVEPVGLDEHVRSPASGAAIAEQRPPDSTGLLGAIIVGDSQQVYASSNFPTSTH